MAGQDKDEVQYKTSIESEADREIIYHYSREHRLSKAPRAVVELNENLTRPARPGFLKKLFGGRGNLIVLVPIIVVCVVIVLNTRAGNAAVRFTLGNNSVSISLVEEDAILILSIEKSLVAGKEPYTGAVDIGVSPVLPEGEQGPVFSHRVFFSMNSPEVFQLALPFENKSIFVILQTEYETIVRTIRR